MRWFPSWLCLRKLQVKKKLNKLKSIEWQDLIKFIEQLIKLLKKYQKVPVIPEKHTLSKRLSQW
jgi:hypothetical protein